MGIGSNLNGNGNGAEKNLRKKTLKNQK